MAPFPPLRLKEALSLGGLSVRELAVRTWHKSNEHEIMTRAAAVAFYAMTALVPFLGFVLFLTAQLLPDLTGMTGEHGIGDLTVERLESSLKALLPREAYTVFQTQIVNLQKQPPVGLLSLSLVVILWLASSLYVAVIDAMNRIYGVVETRSFLKIRLTAIVVTVVEAVILVGALVAIVAWPQFLRWIGLSVFAALAVTLVQWAVLLVMILLSFALTLYTGPDADQHWEWITPGSLVGTVVFLVSCLGLRIYVQNFAHYDQFYGPLGGVMVLLFWFWVSSLVLLASGEVNKIIEDASPLGKGFGQKTDPALSPDFDAMKPEPAER